MYLEDSVKKWVFFFYVLDANKDGVLEHQDMDDLLDRLIDAKPHLFTTYADAKYVDFLMHKNFDRLLIEATNGKHRQITMKDWVDLIRRNNTSKRKSYFLRWFSASAVRFLFDLCDHNKDGYIDFDEFEDLYQILGLSRGNIIYAFRAIDENRDGVLSKIELYNAISDFFFERNKSGANFIFGEYRKLSTAYYAGVMKSE